MKYEFVYLKKSILYFLTNIFGSYVTQLALMNTLNLPMK